MPSPISTGRDKARWNVYGMPLPPRAYHRLFDHLTHRLIPNDTILRHYLEGRGAPTDAGAAEDELDQANSFPILAIKGNLDFTSPERFDSWPHLTGELGINPLYVQSRGDGANTCYRLRFPSDQYARENSEMKEYLPETFHLSASQQQSLRENRVDGLADLGRCCAIMGFAYGFHD